MPQFIVQGRGPVNLSDSKDFMAEGGEGKVYVQGTLVYKVWHDPNEMVPPAKVRELQPLGENDSIIVPRDVLLRPSDNVPTGITMPRVENAFVLCQMFPKAFRDRTGLTPDTTLKLVRKLQQGVRFVHSKGALIVDLNEMNFLVAEDYSKVFFIDTTTYKTRNFPATALMESVRDRHTKGFTEGTDWFAFAVVSFNMFVGIHPYRGKYPPVDSSVPKTERMDARMRANVSVLHDGVGLPGAVLPFTVIPPAYLDWYRAVLEEGKRVAPPEDLQPQIALAAAAPQRVAGSGHFDVVPFGAFDDEVVSVFGDLVLTRKSLFAGGKRVAAADPDSRVAVTPRLNHAVVASYRKGLLHLIDATAGKALHPVMVDAQAVMSHRGRLYVKSGESILEVTFVERADQIIAGTRRVANAMEHATEFFDGVAVQTMLKSTFANFFPHEGASFQARLNELEGYRVVDAKHEAGVLIVVGTKGGKYDKFVYRFSPDYARRDLRVVNDVPYTGINLTVREDGLAFHLNEADELEVFKAKPDGGAPIVMTDDAITGDVKLAHVGAQALFARGNELFRFSSKRK